MIQIHQLYAIYFPDVRMCFYAYFHVKIVMKIDKISILFTHCLMYAFCMGHSSVFIISIEYPPAELNDITEVYLEKYSV